MLIDLLCALVLAWSGPAPALPAPPSPPPVLEARTGRIVLYGPSWGDWTGPATEKRGIAARQGVTPAPGEWCIATWYRTDRNRTGTLEIAGRTIPVRVCDYAAPEDLPRIQELGIAGEIPYPLAVTVPGMVADGWVTGTLVLERTVSITPLACATKTLLFSSGHAFIAAPTSSRPLPR